MDGRRRDEELMHAALAEARKGLGRTSPNPMVGVVLVRDGAVVGVGHHARAGAPHAEPMALAMAGEAARGAELYVNLEPCCHRGRTQPCTTALIESGVRRVVAGIIDPNPLVSGKGLAALRAAGIDVTVGVLEDQCARLNAPFFKYIQSGMPWVTAKWAMTLDGRIATRTGDARWITGEAARAEAHRLRHRNDAILVGVGTVLADDPALTTRNIPNGRDPIRVVLDTHGRIPPAAQVLQSRSGTPTWVFCAPEVADSVRQHVSAPHEVIALEAPGGKLPIAEVLRELGRREVMSLLVEGGSAVLGAFHEAGQIDAVTAFVAAKLIGGRDAPGAIGGGGLAAMAEAWTLLDVAVERVGEDLMISGLVGR